MPRKIFIALLNLLFIFSFTSSPVHAADFSPAETTKVMQLQQKYATLDKTPFGPDNLYEVKPRFKGKFKEGKLAPSYLKSQLAYINFYRELFGLNPIRESKKDNQNAQKTAAILALLNVNPLVNQHNFPHQKRPKIIKKATWKRARITSNLSNLNFDTRDQTAGDVITDLLTDRYNLSGSDTGHRAWILSTRLTTVGAGAAYGTNGYRYSVQKVFNPADVFRKTSQEIVTYPNSGVFPIELVQGKNIAWSIYFSNQNIKSIPEISITDLDTGKTYQAENVRNYSNKGYGNFQTLITYSPGLTPLIVNHEYRVDISQIASYSFKLFQLY